MHGVHELGAGRLDEALALITFHACGLDGWDTSCLRRKRITARRVTRTQWLTS